MLHQDEKICSIVCQGQFGRLQQSWFDHTNLVFTNIDRDTPLGISSFFLSEPLCGSWKVREDEASDICQYGFQCKLFYLEHLQGNEGKDDRDHRLNDEEPSPSSNTVCSVKVFQDTGCNQATKHVA